ncbi:TonB-dependent siderophore receptor [Sphingomonas sp.]|uniref:TonB-dependent siderophore receptor n=1 Tax=Sphingomonas sp. TaxID=28214 RepID=UPI0031DF230B
MRDARSGRTADSGTMEASDPDQDDVIVNGLRTDDGQNRVARNGALGAKTLIDTPYSLTVIDESDIRRRQATSIGQIFANDPSVYSAAPAGTTNWWGTQIRGLDVRSYYVDDVPMLLYWGGDFPLEPIESVNALKGLTGFMYGFGSPGGVISYRTKRPTDKPMLATDLGYRTDSVFYARVDAGGPVTQDGALGYRLNLGGEKGTTYSRAGVNRYVGSLALDYRISPDLHWYATGTYEDSDLRHEPFTIYWDELQGNVLPRVTYDYDKLNIANSYYRTKTLAVATGLDWAVAADWSVRLTYGYTSKLHHSNKAFVYLDNPAGDYTGYAYNFAELDRYHFAQALVQGDVTTGPVRHEVVAGVAFQASFSDFGINDYYWGHDFDGNLYRDQPFRVTRAIRFSTDGSPTQDQQRALFLSDTLHLGEQWQVMLGARYTHYTLLDRDGDPQTDSSYRANKVSPTVALIFKPAPYVTLYTSYVEAMEPGSRVAGQYANAGEVLKPTVSKQYEAGVKYEHGRLSLTSAAFQVERANTIDRIVNGARWLTQDGLTRYRGVEAIARYRVTNDVRIGAGVVHLDPRIRNVSAGNEDLLGNRPQGTANWQATGNVEYFPSVIPGLSLHGAVRHTGAMPTSDANTLYLPGYTTANAGFQYQMLVASRKVTVTGNVNNLTNVKYWTLTNVGEGINGALGIRVDW